MINYSYQKEVNANLICRGGVKMKKYREVIAMGFSSEMELNAFLSTIENDENISDLAYYNLRHIAIERFYEI